MGEHKRNPNCQLAKDGRLPPKVKTMGKRETERYIQAMCLAKMAEMLTKKEAPNE